MVGYVHWYGSTTPLPMLFFEGRKASNSFFSEENVRDVFIMMMDYLLSLGLQVYILAFFTPIMLFYLYYWLSTREKFGALNTSRESIDFRPQLPLGRLDTDQMHIDRAGGCLQPSLALCTNSKTRYLTCTHYN